MTADLRVRDLGVALAFLTGGLLLMLVVPDARITWSPPEPEGPLHWPDVVALVVACLGATQRRTRPVLALALAGAALAAGPLLIGATGVGVVLAYADVLYCAVRYSRRRASLIVAGIAVAIVAAVAGANLVTDGPGAAVRATLNVSALFLIPVVWAREVRQHERQAEIEREGAAQARRLADLDAAAAVAAERARMARDLHDVIAGQLSAIAIQSEAALTAPHADPELLRRVLSEVRRGSVASLSEMRTMIGLLRADGSADGEPRTAPAGLDRIDALLDAGRASGLRVELDDRRPPGDTVPAAVDLAAYRIVQESLTNAAKHAPGATVRCALRHEEGELRVEIDNDLVAGARPGGGTGTGLLGLGERAAAVGGRVEAGPRDGTWTVRATLPAAVAR